MGAQEAKAAEFLKQRIALVSEIDKTEFQWKKKKREMLEAMARYLAEHVRSTERAKEIREKIERVETEAKRDQMNALGKELGFKGVKLEE